MPKVPSKLTCSAGEHFVAYKLSSLGYVAAMTREGSPTVDILASNLDASKTLAIQVKTTDWAMRTRGRGKNKEPFQLQFPLGYKSATTKGDNLVFAFVDLRGIDSDTEPDVYIVPSPYVCDHCKGWVDDVKLVRFHVPIDSMEDFKNNWALVQQRLA